MLWLKITKLCAGHPKSLKSQNTHSELRMSIEVCDVVMMQEEMVAKLLAEAE